MGSGDPGVCRPRGQGPDTAQCLIIPSMSEGDGDSCPGQSDMQGKALRCSGRNIGRGAEVGACDLGQVPLPLRGGFSCLKMALTVSL